MKYEIQYRPGQILCRLLKDEEEISMCEIDVDETTRSWNIIYWFTYKGLGNRGFGKMVLGEALRRCMEKYGSPASIRYTWNGANAYVLEWIERHFDAVCTCPIAVQKTQAEDDWDSHIYELDKEKVLKYFEIIREETNK